MELKEFVILALDHRRNLSNAYMIVFYRLYR